MCTQKKCLNETVLLSAQNTLFKLMGKAEMPTIPIFVESYNFKANFRITISNVKITANNNFKMVPDKITGVTPTFTMVIPYHR